MSFQNFDVNGIDDTLHELEHEISIESSSNEEDFIDKIDISRGELVSVGINEYLLDSVVKSSVPSGASRRCTGWLNLRIVKGRVCFWTGFSDPDIEIDGTKVKGSIRVDVGGAIEACHKKFYDCSWEWECGKLSLSLQGRPGIKLKLKRSSGIKFSAQLDGKLAIKTNLPYPFDKIIEAQSRLVYRIFQTIINIIIKRINFKIVPDLISIPNQNTKLKLAGFSPFSFTREEADPLLPSQRKFLGYLCGVDAVS